MPVDRFKTLGGNTFYSKEEQEMITTDRAELEAILKERQQEAD